MPSGILDMVKLQMIACMRAKELDYEFGLANSLRQCEKF